MKIGVYSDLHVSRVSSIMPLYTGKGKYTTRLNMIIETAKWMYEEFEKNNVDIIVNCGDTMDSSTVKAEELSAVTEFYKQSRGIKEYHVVGNHEMKDSDREFYSSSVLSGFDFINIIDNPSKLYINDYAISFLPYTNPEDISYGDIKLISSNILFSHIDIKGSALRGTYIMDTGVDPEWLAENFKLTVNGHLHTPEVIKTSQNVVQNIGSISSISFVDSSSYIPSICIIDTDKIGTKEYLKRIKNPSSILFRKLIANSASDVIKYLRTLENYKYIVSVTCPYEIRSEVKDILNDDSRIIANRVLLDMTNHEAISSDVKACELNEIDVMSEFLKYLQESDLLKYGSISDYIDVLNMEV